MSSTRQLYELQEIDLAIEKQKSSLTDLAAKIGNDSILVSVRQELEEGRKQLKELQKRQRDLEREIEAYDEKISDLYKKLYGGSVKNPKELINLKEEYDHFQVQRSDLEDLALEIMADVDSAKEQVAIKNKVLESADKEWNNNQQQFLQEQSDIHNELSELTEKRLALLSTLDRPSINLYDNLKISCKGEPVAKIEQGMCKGCRITIPMSYIQKARIGQELIQCSHCGRILHVS